METVPDFLSPYTSKTLSQLLSTEATPESIYLLFYINDRTVTFSTSLARSVDIFFNVNLALLEN